MTDAQILERVKKSIDLYEDKTFELKDLYGSMLQIIQESIQDEKVHKERLEKVLYDLDELQAVQAKFWSGHKYVLQDCKRMEKELMQKKNNLLAMGYSIMRFKIKTQQGKLL